MILKISVSHGRSAPTAGQYTIFKETFSETAWPIEAKLRVEHS